MVSAVPVLTCNATGNTRLWDPESDVTSIMSAAGVSASVA